VVNGFVKKFIARPRVGRMMEAQSLRSPFEGDVVYEHHRSR